MTHLLTFQWLITLSFKVSTHGVSIWHNGCLSCVDYNSITIEYGYHHGVKGQCQSVHS